MDNLAGRQPIFLSPEGQHVLSVIGLKSDLPPYTNSTINVLLNGLGRAAGGGEGEEDEFLATVRASIVACFIGRDDINEIITDEQRGLTTTIIDTEEWLKGRKTLR